MNKIVNGVANDYEYDFLDNIARDYIERHTTHIKGYTEEYVETLLTKIDQLTNNWNELEEWLKSYIALVDNPDTLEEQTLEDLKEVLDKMEEIKENNNVSSRD